ncbi:MAG: NADH:flavin oxidoreductase/NADH oxidase family protein [Thalassolituus oleivorans]|uniref:NADH:flavin oxidoreductase/NADH oxidase family protein n=1 Tax=Thalassolituus oleivorans TaxID=187493 RepID=UPI001B715281|nr:NADH:flavin oxidoreductase/NADH oxidase family protein [Thalassolituus oleivorans]MBQ0728223.1 NADH:flavin oxidoreductase/NADH oxidase family protein [Thalassolituus oleivorans]MBQ0781493.1 NADH:flavin oxidoreductase/NADH oxidase family protein [Thalassolituus oleivorans]
MTLYDELQLPNGTTIPNRIAKAAMEENMADSHHAPSAQLIKLYDAWANGKAGLIITGNVMIDRRAMTGPGGVVLENADNLKKFKQWSHAARVNGAQFWMQINHPGRQMMANLGQQTWAPSAIALDLGSMSKHFGMPSEMTEAVIADVIKRFANTAELSEEAGFTGVQIHAAHGYLLSQFLSPLTNHRNDTWGGSIDNRARLLIEVVKAVRSTVSANFSVSVKLNSADFQRGGFSTDDAKKVIEMLNPLNVDLVELSGGSYEAPAMQGVSKDGRTLAREAYFFEFAKDIQVVAEMPIMVTGGIRRRPVAEEVVTSGIDMIGMATALAIDPNLPLDWAAGLNNAPQLKPIRWKNKAVASLANMAVVKYQLNKLSLGKPCDPNISPLRALVLQQIKTSRLTRRYRKNISEAK